MSLNPSVLLTNRICGILSMLFISFHGYTQDPFPTYAPIYKDDVIARVDITIPEDSLAIILAPGNEQSEYYFHASFLFDNGTIRDSFHNAGFQLRGNTSRFAGKKSFQVSLNKYVPGRTWYGVEKINLNGEHNDPTVSRSKIAWDLLREIGVPAPRSSHVELYINGAYFGLYANVEHIDEEFVQTRFGNNDGNLFKCTWPADMDYLGSDADLYKLTSEGKRVYELKTNEDIDDYTDLALLIDVLNHTETSELPCELEKIFNVNSFLKAIAFDILSGNWDGPLYNKNNFYLYHNQATGLFEYIPYDLDNTFGIDWFSINWAERDIYHWGHDNQPRPLYWRILEVKEYKDRLSYYLDNFVSTFYKEHLLFPRIDTLKAMLAPSIADDEYYRLDYGFTIDDFNDGFGEALPFFHTPIGVKEFISKRRSATLQQLQLNAIDPIISMVTAGTGVSSHEKIIKAFVEDQQDIVSVEARLQWNGNGPVDVMAMFDDGMHGDEDADDGWYGVLLPSIDSAVVVSYIIAAEDVKGAQSLNPVCGSHQLTLSSSAITLAINEFMASNTSTVTDEAGEYEDWIEIYNYGSAALYLGDFYISDKIDNPTKWELPDLTLEASQYLLIWADEDQDQGPLHANFKLSAGGEFIGIFDSDLNNNALINGIDFGAQAEDVPFGRFPNGTGPFMELNPSPGSANQQISSNAEVNRLSEFKLYPNPVTNELNYVAPDNLHPDYYEIINLQGQSIAYNTFPESLAINTSWLLPGLYFLKVGLKGSAEIRRFVKI